MKDNYNINAKELKEELKDKIKNSKAIKKDTQAYCYYSKVLNEPFDSVEELTEAEEAYFAKLNAKKAEAEAKKAEAKKVEEAFVALNAARKSYKEELQAATIKYSEELVALKETYEKIRDEIRERLALAEQNYEVALGDFIEKHPEGYHLTLKDGDFETTISGSTSKGTSNAFDWFDLLFLN